ncbi:hypothetical protein [Izhakiella australiensis]|uniref:hypothetical protein n=1 Tax=Izhakiella australiensis TaxID=1926881 RepID=UPI0015911B31|nr:hypothetical protein [Izhakiella australiensis]
MQVYLSLTFYPLLHFAAVLTVILTTFGRAERRIRHYSLTLTPYAKAIRADLISGGSIAEIAAESALLQKSGDDKLIANVC